MNNHPITPPPELVQQWREEWDKDWTGAAPPMQLGNYIATQAARWGADQELEACREYLEQLQPQGSLLAKRLHSARRPKPPSLKQRALEALEDHEIEWLKRSSIIRRALEALPDD